MNRLSSRTAPTLPAAVARPQYDRSSLQAGILHLGVGAFHRAHQAVYTDAAINHSGGHWGIIGVSMRSESAAVQLNPQQGLYTLRSEDAQGCHLQLIGALQRVLVAPAEPAALDKVMADPGIRVVTLTITEKGYCLGADGWSLDHDRVAIQRDLEQPQLASTAIGILARGLHARCARGGAPLTIISCDNLTENSARLHQVLQDYLAQSFPEVLPWMEQSVSFPCSMVDRIVPAMTAAALTDQARLLGLRDEAAVITEPFSQWIIEDRFAAAVPDWQAVGVEYVADIRPFEALKLGLLNASHSAIAYAGLVSGKPTVSDVVEDKTQRDFIRRLMVAELIPALTAPPGFDVPGYGEQLLQRFANPRLHHRCAQIGMDGTEKIRQRWLPALNNSRTDTLLLKCLAIWCYYILETKLEIDDPRRERLLSLRDSDAPLPHRLTELLGCLDIKCNLEPVWELRVQFIQSHCQAIARGELAALLAR